MLKLRIALALVILAGSLARAGDMQEASAIIDRFPDMLSHDWVLKDGFYFFTVAEASEDDWMIAERFADIVSASCGATRQNTNLSYSGPLHIFSHTDDQGDVQKIYAIRQNLLERSLGLPC